LNKVSDKKVNGNQNVSGLNMFQRVFDETYVISDSIY